ncbi:hypothetical protein SPRG_20146 [Saprolegnia parasitica CBS 223.65]|uniref:CCHC-type domain-containing protein n=1 Tax=Saprolegnia parasitica (strain CBS 223.65) TaxID=695850 RepID=A0A067CCZ5_SAPPC|nr:hypothetical protein SPRG_20146 [Saprolegnia parasitica CBS 223.65]KDO28624.1 hypothetical protein SPRG_20146 [Saprolegnia parasitica CBS 223.65]|eukprot:XP_012200768.1 hypothetical protein SPRG_20146 [Saprolegnia parasitica CBS 223.65]
MPQPDTASLLRPKTYSGVMFAAVLTKTAQDDTALYGGISLYDRQTAWTCETASSTRVSSVQQNPSAYTKPPHFHTKPPRFHCCYNCQESSHRSIDCPELKNLPGWEG